jgi:membrane fusion protein
MTMRPLFRTEALDAQRTSWLGRVQLVQPLSLDLLAAGAVVALIAVALLLAFGRYTRKATIEGVLVPDRGVIRLVPTEAATVVERRIVEGQAVKTGDVMFVLAVARPQLLSMAQADVSRSLAERQRSLQEALRQQVSLGDAQGAALERRVQSLDTEQAQVDAEAALQRQRLALAQQTLARLETLRNEAFISDAQVRTKKEELLGMQAQLQTLERQRTALARERVQLESERRDLPLVTRGVQGTIERDLAALARESAEQPSERQLVMHAPYDGVITALVAEPGQAVSPASALASLVPRGAILQAHLFAPSRAVGFIKPDQVVRLRLEPFPYQKYGWLDGRLLHVSRTPLAAGELAALPLAGAVPPRPGESLFRITAALADAQAEHWPQPLAAGMRLQGDVLLDERRLVEWMLEPVLGLGKRL